MKNHFNLEKLRFPIGEFQKPDSISQNDLEPWIITIETFPQKIKELTENLSAAQLNWIYHQMAGL